MDFSGFIYQLHLPLCSLTATWQKNWQKMKIPNVGLNVFPSGSADRVYQLQDRSSCRMRYLHYPTLENTRSIMKLRTNMYILLNDQSSWRITRTSANDMYCIVFLVLSCHWKISDTNISYFPFNITIILWAQCNCQQTPRRACMYDNVSKIPPNQSTGPICIFLNKDGWKLAF